MNTPKSFESHRHFYQYVDNLSCRAESGFRHVEAKKYTPRLLHVFGEKNKVQIKEVKLKKDYLNNDDVFLIDLGLKIYQWNGDNSNKNERFEAGKHANQLRSDRGGKPSIEVLDNCVVSDVPEELLEIFPDDGKPGSKKPKDKTDAGGQFEKVLFRLVYKIFRMKELFYKAVVLQRSSATTEPLISSPYFSVLVT
ncbi:severin-like [Orbicella faveolata]|uniref:severin-like n=1 Tax=Orbicella faveolata TaxID=48498 RepID=UPI0009E2D5E7|nr:severin-like [Orbicella faveolata]